MTIVLIKTIKIAIHGYRADAIDYDIAPVAASQIAFDMQRTAQIFGIVGSGILIFRTDRPIVWLVHLQPSHRSISIDGDRRLVADVHLGRRGDDLADTQRAHLHVDISASGKRVTLSQREAVHIQIRRRIRGVYVDILVQRAGKRRVRPDRRQFIHVHILRGIVLRTDIPHREAGTILVIWLFHRADVELCHANEHGISLIVKARRADCGPQGIRVNDEGAPFQQPA